MQSGVLPINVLAAVPPDALAKATRCTFYQLTAAWRNSAGGVDNPGQLAASASNKQATLSADGSSFFVAVRGAILPADGTDVYSSTTPLMVEDIRIQGGDSIVSQPTYAPLIFDNAVNASDQLEWPCGIYIPSQGTMVIKISNLTAVAANVMIGLWCWRFMLG